MTATTAASDAMVEPIEVEAGEAGEGGEGEPRGDRSDGGDPSGLLSICAEDGTPAAIASTASTNMERSRAMRRPWLVAAPHPAARSR